MTDYTTLVTQEFQNSPRYMATVSMSTSVFDGLTQQARGFYGDYDLDLSIGAQLDVVGQWVGLSRSVYIPLLGVYFAFDTTGLGFNQGVWEGPFDPADGQVNLDDSDYRFALRAKIASNNWDGTVGGAQQILSLLFPVGAGAYAYLEDRQGDMQALIGFSGAAPAATFLSLLDKGYIGLQSVGVQTVYVVPSTVGSTLFGFDVNNQFIAGFDVGVWGVSPSA